MLSLPSRYQNNEELRNSLADTDMVDIEAGPGEKMMLVKYLDDVRNDMFGGADDRMGVPNALIIVTDSNSDDAREKVCFLFRLCCS